MTPTPKAKSSAEALQALDNLKRLTIVLGAAVVFFMWFSAYQGRVDIRDSQVHSCHTRGTPSLVAQSSIARSTGHPVIAASLGRIARQPCASVYPAAKLFPILGF